MNTDNVSEKEKRIIISWGRNPSLDDGYEEHRLDREEMYKILEIHKKYLANPGQFSSYGLSFICKDGVQVSYDIRDIVRVIIHDHLIVKNKKERPR